MAIVKPLTKSPVEVGPEGEPMDVEIDILPDVEEPMEMDDEGNVIITYGENYADTDVGGHDENLAELMRDDDLEKLGSELVEQFLSDRNSRKEWAETYIKGLDLLGMKIEERQEPWAGASGVFHPMLTEAVVRFQAQAMGELMPASGPVRSKIVGKMTPDILKQSQRVQTELNYLITEEMPDYREEMEQLLFKLPLAGSAFKKVYFDPINNVPCSVFVPAEDFVVSYGASNLRTCPRYTHVMRRTVNEVRKMQVSGFYRDVDLPEPTKEVTDIEEKYIEMSGVEAGYEDDDRHMLLEMHVDLDLPEPFGDPDGIARPYVVTVDKASRIVLAVRRNWDEDDETYKKRMHFVHYPYLPGMGFYGTGLTHLIGSIARSATSILRQLIDAGTLSNLPGGLKDRSVRVKGDNTPIMPGEWRDADVTSGTLREALFPIPYKEPSGVLYQLLGNLVEEGRRIGSVADIQIGDVSPQAPVGTTLALLERSLKVMSGVQARLHAALKLELRLLARIVHEYMDETYLYEVDGDFNRKEDFDGRVDVIPVSDPNAATMAQRIMQYQAALQLSQQAPQLYDMGKLHRQMLEVLGIQDADDIVKLPEDLKPKDPVAENMAILKQEPVKAFLYQDHEAHIAAHMAAAQDPKIQQIVGQSPFAAAIQSAMAAHVTEHVAMAYRRKMEEQLGVALPPEDEPLPEDVEVQLSAAVAQAAGKLLQQNQAEAAQQQAQQQEQDPLTQIQKAELEIKRMQTEHTIQMDRAKLELDKLKHDAKVELERERLSSENQREGARVGARIAEALDKGAREERIKGAELGIRIAEDLYLRGEELQDENDRDNNVGEDGKD